METEKVDRTLREVATVGRDAVWSVSTAKHGCGVEHLRDNNFETYWESDTYLQDLQLVTDRQPHVINIQFHRKTSVTWLWFYFNFNRDGNCTPQKISIRVGTTFHDLKKVHVIELEEPCGWVKVPIGKLFDNNAEILRTHFIQVSIILMHLSQNGDGTPGRDTRIRQVKIFGPRMAAWYHNAKSTGGTNVKDYEPEYNTVEMRQFAQIR